MAWKPVELIVDYWIILDQDYAEEYKDKHGDNFAFVNKQEALNFIKGLTI